MAIRKAKRLPRPRTNDPLGVSDNPVTVSDPERLRALTEEFKRRLDYVRSSYLTWKQTVETDADFNRSLGRLRKAINRRRPRRIERERLHPELEILVSEFARRAATARMGQPDAEVTERDIATAAVEVVEKIRPRRGRSADRVLRHHVEGLMALVQEISGKPVRARDKLANIYDPGLLDDVSQVLAIFFDGVDPSVTETALANIVLDARRKYAGKPMHFADFFPAYGAGEDKFGLAQLAPPFRLERFTANIPIYSG